MYISISCASFDFCALFTSVHTAWEKVKNRLNFVLLSISRIIIIIIIVVIIINFDQLETPPIEWLLPSFVRMPSCERMSKCIHTHRTYKHVFYLSVCVCVCILEKNNMEMERLVKKWMRILHISRLTPPDVCITMSYTIHYAKNDQSNWHEDYVESINKSLIMIDQHSSTNKHYRYDQKEEKIGNLASRYFLHHWLDHSYCAQTTITASCMCCSEEQTNSAHEIAWKIKRKKGREERIP